MPLPGFCKLRKEASGSDPGARGPCCRSGSGSPTPRWQGLSGSLAEPGRQVGDRANSALNHVRLDPRFVDPDRLGSRRHSRLRARDSLTSGRNCSAIGPERSTCLLDELTHHGDCRPTTAPPVRRSGRASSGRASRPAARAAVWNLQDRPTMPAIVPGRCRLVPVDGSGSPGMRTFRTVWPRREPWFLVLRPPRPARRGPSTALQACFPPSSKEASHFIPGIRFPILPKMNTL